MDRILSNDAAAVLDCTLMNRIFLQGPDPLFLMETCPYEFNRLCQHFSISSEEGRDAIEAAHVQGPGVLLEGRGLNLELPWLDDMESLPTANRREMLWLILAACSDCTETGYKDSASLTERVQRAVSACLRLQWEASNREGTELVGAACSIARRLISTTVFTLDPKFSVPMSDQDHGFYVGYKLGHPVVAVRAGTTTFYGTIPSTSLVDHGITVDKLITPQFGLVFPK